MKLLLVEDDLDLGNGVRLALQDQRFDVTWVRRIAEARPLLDQGACDLLVLDLGLPDGDGLSLLARVRRERKDLPILILTARDGLDDRLRGLDGGADDYVVKPFALAELLSRIRALRRRSLGTEEQVFDVRGLVLNERSRRVSVFGREIDLSPSEFALLAALIRRPDQVFSRHMLEEEVLPGSFATMQGFGVHTFRFVNAEGQSVFVKFHWNPKAGTHSLVWDEAVKISGADPDYNRRDLWERIEAGAYPEYELGVQVFTEQEADAFSFDILDATKLIPEELVPVRPIGRMVLNRNPDNFFAETEQVAFCAAHVVPGIDFSNDPLLAGRIHSYVDTQISRLGGPNFHEIPINTPLTQVHNNQRDGMHRQAIHRGKVAYEPNSLGGGCPFQAGAAQGFVSVPARIEARAAQGKVRAKPEKFADHYTQAKLFFNSQSPFEQAHIAAAFRFELSKVTVPAIRERMVSSLRNVSEELANQVAAKLGITEMPEPMPKALTSTPAAEVNMSPSLSLLARPGETGIQGRKVALLVANGVEAESLIKLHSKLFELGAVPRFVAPHIGPLTTSKGAVIDADASLENEPGFLFDALVLPDGERGVRELAKDGHTLEFIKDQYRHCKPIMVMTASTVLMHMAQIPPLLPSGNEDPGIVVGIDDSAIAQFVSAIARHRHPERETDPPAV